eukprot:scaffold364256_cov44-Attheya_sp.AAC.1
MDLPNEDGLTSKEKNARVKFASEDDPSHYPDMMGYSFRDILRFAKAMPPSVNGETSMAHMTGDTALIPMSNWDETMGGYDNWGVPMKSDEHVFQRTMRTQFMYGGLGSSKLQEPYQQVQHIMAAYQERKLNEYSQAGEFQNGSSQLYILLIRLHPVHTEGTKTNVWRIVACHADTNLDSFHDQIMAPAMGWRRHYHAYKFIIPTSGVVFGPQNSDAIDMMHST